MRALPDKESVMCDAPPGWLAQKGAEEGPVRDISEHTLEGAAALQHALDTHLHMRCLRACLPAGLATESHAHRASRDVLALTLTVIPNSKHTSSA